MFRKRLKSTLLIITVIIILYVLFYGIAQLIYLNQLVKVDILNSKSLDTFSIFELTFNLVNAKTFFPINGFILYFNAFLTIFILLINGLFSYILCNVIKEKRIKIFILDAITLIPLGLIYFIPLTVSEELEWSRLYIVGIFLLIGLMKYYVYKKLLKNYSLAQVKFILSDKIKTCWKEKLIDTLYIILIIIIALIVMTFIIFPSYEGFIYGEPTNDCSAFYYPNMHEIDKYLKHGAYRLWDFDTRFGMSFIVEYNYFPNQHSPIVFLRLFMFSFIDVFEYNWDYFFFVTLGGIGLFLLLRSLRVGRVISLISCIFYMFNGHATNSFDFEWVFFYAFVPFGTMFFLKLLFEKNMKKKYIFGILAGLILAVGISTDGDQLYAVRIGTFFLLIWIGFIIYHVYREKNIAFIKKTILPVALIFIIIVGLNSTFYFQYLNGYNNLFMRDNPVSFDELSRYGYENHKIDLSSPLTLFYPFIGKSAGNNKFINMHFEFEHPHVLYFGILGFIFFLASFLLKNLKGRNKLLVYILWIVAAFFFFYLIVPSALRFRIYQFFPMPFAFYRHPYVDKMFFMISMIIISAISMNAFFKLNREYLFKKAKSFFKISVSFFVSLIFFSLLLNFYEALNEPASQGPVLESVLPYFKVSNFKYFFFTYIIFAASFIIIFLYIRKQIGVKLFLFFAFLITIVDATTFFDVNYIRKRSNVNDYVAAKEKKTNSYALGIALPSANSNRWIWPYNNNVTKRQDFIGKLHDSDKKEYCEKICGMTQPKIHYVKNGLLCNDQRIAQFLVKEETFPDPYSAVIIEADENTAFPEKNLLTSKLVKFHNDTDKYSYKNIRNARVKSKKLTTLSSYEKAKYFEGLVSNTSNITFPNINFNDEKSEKYVVIRYQSLEDIPFYFACMDDSKQYNYRSGKFVLKNLSGNNESFSIAQFSLGNAKIQGDLRLFFSEVVDKKVRLDSLYIYEKNPSNSIAQDNYQDFSTVDIKRRWINQEYFNVDMKDDGFLYIAESYYPDWEISCNKEEYEYYPANGYFRTIFLNKGKYDVSMKYLPSFYFIGLFITALLYVSLIIIIIILYIRIRREKIYKMFNERNLK